MDKDMGVGRWLAFGLDSPLTRFRTLRTTGGAGRRQVPGPGFVGGRGRGLWTVRIRRSPHSLIGVSKSSIRRKFPDISGHSAPLSDLRIPGWHYGRECFTMVGKEQVSAWGTFKGRERGCQQGIFWVGCLEPETDAVSAVSAVNWYPRHSRCGEIDGGGDCAPILTSPNRGKNDTSGLHQPQFEMQLPPGLDWVSWHAPFR